jgi:hypothetical protein
MRRREVPNKGLNLLNFISSRLSACLSNQERSHADCYQFVQFIPKFAPDHPDFIPDPENVAGCNKMSALSRHKIIDPHVDRAAF